MDRETAEKAVIDAALNLSAVTLAHGFCLPVPNTTPTLYVALGEADEAQKLIRLSAQQPNLASNVNSVFFDSEVLQNLRFADTDEEMRDILDTYIAERVKA